MLSNISAGAICAVRAFPRRRDDALSAELELQWGCASGGDFGLMLECNERFKIIMGKYMEIIPRPILLSSRFLLKLVQGLLISSTTIYFLRPCRSEMAPRIGGRGLARCLHFSEGSGPQLPRDSR